MEINPIKGNVQNTFNSGSPIIVRVPHEVAFDLNKTQTVLQNVLNKLGCRACTSGFDIRFTIERDFIVNPKTLEVNSVQQF